MKNANRRHCRDSRWRSFPRVAVWTLSLALLGASGVQVVAEGGRPALDVKPLGEGESRRATVVERRFAGGGGGAEAVRLPVPVDESSVVMLGNHSAPSGGVRITTDDQGERWLTTNAGVDSAFGTVSSEAWSSSRMSTSTARR